MSLCTTWTQAADSPNKRNIRHTISLNARTVTKPLSNSITQNSWGLKISQGRSLTSRWFLFLINSNFYFFILSLWKHFLKQYWKRWIANSHDSLISSLLIHIVTELFILHTRRQILEGLLQSFLKPSMKRFLMSKNSNFMHESKIILSVFCWFIPLDNLIFLLPAPSFGWVSKKQFSFSINFLKWSFFLTVKI